MDSANDFDRIEVIVEATALEVERISEGNRFMAKLLAETHRRPRSGKSAGARHHASLVDQPPYVRRARRRIEARRPAW